MDKKILKRTTIQIIDTYPYILKTNIPLFDMLIISLYYILAPFYLLYRGLKNKENFFSMLKRKKEVSFGKEAVDAVDYSLKDIKINTDLKEKVLLSEIVFHDRRESRKIIEELLDGGIAVNKNRISNNVCIKTKIEKVEVYDLESFETIRVVYSYPKLAIYLNKLFKINRGYLDEN